MQNSTAFIFLIFILCSPLLGIAQPTIDGDLSDSNYKSLATKQNNNFGFGPNINVTEIVNYSDVANSKLYVGVKGTLDVGTNNGIGLFLNFSGIAGAPAGSNLGFDGAGHYMDGQGGGTNQAFKADFDVDYMFAMNPGSGSSSVFLDAAKKAGGNSTDFIGTATQFGGPVTDANVFGTGGSATYAFNNGGSPNQGFEIVFDYSALGINATMNIEAFAFVISDSGFFSDVTAPGNASAGNLGFNPDFTSISGGLYHSGSATLPIDLGDFNAVLDRQNNTVGLNWMTLSEINNAYFEIEKSSDGRNFEAIGKVMGAINSFDKNSYDFTDKHPNEGLNYYRLRQVDLDGNYTFSNILTISIKNTGVRLFPNPVKDLLSIEIKNAAEASLKVFNIHGQIIQASRLNEETLQDIDLSNLQSGIYLIQLRDEHGTILHSQSILKE